MHDIRGECKLLLRSDKTNGLGRLTKDAAWEELLGWMRGAENAYKVAEAFAERR